MRIGLNLLYLLPAVVGGTETYARRLLTAFAALNNEAPVRRVQYVVFLNRESRDLSLPDGPGIERVVCPIAASRQERRYMWEQEVLPRVVRAAGVDVLHSLGYVGPIAAGVPHVVTVHDCNFLHRDVRMSARRRIALGATVAILARRAKMVLTVSEFSRAEMIARLCVDPGKIHVTPLAPDPAPSSVPDRASARTVPPVVLAFASAAPHKNIPALIAASDRLFRSRPHCLRIVGRTPPGSEIERAARRAGGHIELTGFISDAAVQEEMCGATLLAFPSLYEGFGLPVLQAQAMGLPVACSRVAALPEVTGGEAILFDPRSVDDIARALDRLLGDAALRQRLAISARRHAAGYSWSRTALLTLAAYRSALRPARDSNRMRLAASER